MVDILVGRPSEHTFDAPTLSSLYRFRHHIFHDKLGWDVSSYEGEERDDYDTIDPVYIVSQDEENHVDGCGRLLPTQGPYMLKDVFPQLLRGEQAPSAPDVWELSRCAVQTPDRDARLQASFSYRSFEIMHEAYKFAIKNGVREYVMVTSVAIERMMKAGGLKLQRFGDGKAQHVGKVLTVACRIPVNSESHAAILNAMETHVPGRRAA
ncbi:MAG: acyl-homoserine-lactone synthase [Pseudomonadota bacterium]|nr:acyl-homoserine-lactone synthase [Pseudomonadota bacterium]